MKNVIRMNENQCHNRSNHKNPQKYVSKLTNAMYTIGNKMTGVSKHHGINDNMSLLAAAIMIPMIAFLAFKLYGMLQEDSAAEAAKLAKRDSKKGRKGSKKE